MKNWQKIAMIVGIVGGLPAASAAVWWGWSHAVNATVEDRFDALNVAVLKHEGDLEAVGKSIAWIQLENYERMIKRGRQLTRQQCAAYQRLAKRLGVPPMAC